VPLQPTPSGAYASVLPATDEPTLEGYVHLWVPEAADQGCSEPQDFPHLETVTGYAIGGNPEAARISGIRVDRTVIIAFALCGAIVAITGTNGKTTVTTLTATILSAAGLRTIAAGNGSTDRWLYRRMNGDDDGSKPVRLPSA